MPSATSQRHRVDAYDLEFGITERGRSGLGVAGKDPHLLAFTQKRLGQ